MKAGRAVAVPAVCFGMSLALHGAVLAAAAFWALGGVAELSLVRVAILTGGAGGSGSIGKTSGGRRAMSGAVVAPGAEVGPEAVNGHVLAARAAAPRVVGEKMRGRATHVTTRGSPANTLRAAARAPGRKVESEARENGETGARDEKARGEVKSETFPGNAGAMAAAGAASRWGAGSGSGAGNGSGAGTGAADGAGGRARCLRCPEPSFPLIARRRGWQGTVDVGLVLLADGSVGRASVRRSSGHAVLDRAALHAAKRSRFALPADGPRAPVRAYIEYRFELAGSR